MFNHKQIKILSKLKRNIIANYIGQAWSGIMAVSFLPLYIEYLGVEAYGLIGVFVVLQTVLVLLDLGMTPTLNREMARFSAGEHTSQSIRNLLRSLEVICISIASVIIILVWLTSGYIANVWLNIETLSIDVVITALIIIGVVIALRFFEGIYRGCLYGLEKQVKYNVTFAVLTTLRYAGSVVILMFISNSILAFFIWQGIISFLSVMVFAFSVYKILPKNPEKSRFSIASLSSVWKFATGVLGISALTAVMLHADKILLSRMVTLTEFSYYSLAATAASVLFMIVVPVTQAIYPRLVKLTSHGDYDEVSKIYHLMTQLITILIAPAAIILSVYSNGVVYMWSGDSELAVNTGPLLTILILGCFFNGLAHIPYQLQLANGWTKLLLKTNLFVVSILVTSMIIYVPEYGAIAAAWAWFVANVIYLIISTFFMHLRLMQQEKKKWYFSDIVLPSSGALILIVLAFQFKPEMNLNRLEWIIFLIVTWILSSITAFLLASSVKQRFMLAFKKYEFRSL